MARPILQTIIQAGRRLRSRDARLELIHDWRRQLVGEPVLPARPIGCVLFLCHGNICRSPFAAAYLAERRPGIDVRSSGIAAGEAAPADPAAVRVAARFGHDLSRHRSRPLRPDDLEHPDLVLAMEASQVAAFRARAPALAKRVYRLGDFRATRPFDIPDPWGCSEAVIERTFSQIATAVDRLTERWQGPPSAADTGTPLDHTLR